VLIVVFLFGWATLFRFAMPNESWQDMYATPIVVTLAVLGFRWAPEPGAPRPTTLRARRARAWVGTVGLVAMFPLLAWLNGMFDGFQIGAFMLVAGILMERWGLADFKLHDLFGDSDKPPKSPQQVSPPTTNADRY